MRKIGLFFVIITLVVLSFYMFRSNDITGYVSVNDPTDEISASVADTTAPVITIVDINNVTYTDNVVLVQEKIFFNITTNEDSSCRIRTMNYSFEDMYSNCENITTKNKYCLLTHKSNNLYESYIACADTTGNSNNVSNNKEVTYTVELASPPASPSIGISVLNGDPYVKSITTTRINHTILLILIPVNSLCKISEKNESYLSMGKNCGLILGGTVTTCDFSEQRDRTNFNISAPNGKYSLAIACRDPNLKENYVILNYSIDYELPDNEVPVLSDIKAVSVTNQSARIEWKTDENATSVIAYNASKTKIDIINKILSVSGLFTAHAVPVSGLSPEKIYYYKVKSCDKRNNCKISDIYNFTTTKTPEDSDPPSVQDLAVNYTSNYSVEITWNTNENSLCDLSYGISKSNLSKHINSSSYSKSYKIEIEDLTYKITYYYKITCKDTQNNSGSTGYKEFVSEMTNLCNPKFECGDWGECKDGIQIKVCIDKNKCLVNKTEQQICTETDSSSSTDDDYSGTDDSSDNTDSSSDSDNSDNSNIDDDSGTSFGMIVFIIFIVIVVAGLGGVYVMHQKGMLSVLDPYLKKFSKKQQISDEIKIDPLKSYVDQMKKAGYSDDQVYHNLIKYGYRPDQINKYF